MEEESWKRKDDEDKLIKNRLQVWKEIAFLNWICFGDLLRETFDEKENKMRIIKQW